MSVLATVAVLWLGSTAGLADDEDSPLYGYTVEKITQGMSEGVLKLDGVELSHYPSPGAVVCRHQPCTTAVNCVITTGGGGGGSNNPPADPSSLDQYNLNNTVIPPGFQAASNSVVFRATVSDPDNNQVQIQVEIAPVGNNYVSGVLMGTGDLVNSGSQASVTLSNIPQGSYHWRVRAVDSLGAVSNWAYYNNSDAAITDFVVALTGGGGGGGTPDFSSKAKCGALGIEWIILAGALVVLRRHRRQKFARPNVLAHLGRGRSLTRHGNI